MVLQRNRARHAQLAAHEVETGGTEPDLPEFWDEDVDALSQDPNGFARHYEDRSMSQDVPAPTPGRKRSLFGYRDREDEEDWWAREAAEAEQAELEAEDLDIARRVEEALGMTMPTSRAKGRDGEGERMEMDWEAFEAMDLE